MIDFSCVDFTSKKVETTTVTSIQNEKSKLILLKEGELYSIILIEDYPSCKGSTKSIEVALKYFDVWAEMFSRSVKNLYKAELK